MPTTQADTDTVPLLPEMFLSKSDVIESGTAGGLQQRATNMFIPKKKLIRCGKILIVAATFASMFVFVKVHFFGHQSLLGVSVLLKPYRMGANVEYDVHKRLLTFSDDLQSQHLYVEIPDENLASAPDWDSCSEIVGPLSMTEERMHAAEIHPICLGWRRKAQVILSQYERKGCNCYLVNWTAMSVNGTLENCVQLDEAFWYGGSLLGNDQWPLNDVSVPMQPFTSAPLTPNTFGSSLDWTHHGPVLERMWINSAGFGIFVDGSVPLHVSINAGGSVLLCLRAKYANSRYKPGNDLLTLNYAVCMDRTAKHVHSQMMKTFITLPVSPPREELLRDPVWSTRGVNMHNLTQNQALELQLAIRNHKLPHSQFHISGNFTRSVGGLYFDWDRFPNAHQMTGQMAFDGFNVSTTILPFLEMGVSQYEEGRKIGAFITTDNKQVAGHIVDNKTVALIDFTNPQACEWMSKHLESFKKESGIKAFHFHSGEAILLPSSRETTIPLLNPTDYSTYYAKFAHSFGDGVVMGSGYHSQHYGLMVDIGAHASSWGYDSGLKSIIPSVLTLGLMGYPFLLVGPVGGVPNSFNVTSNAFSFPPRELYIRWLQLSVFLPAFEISIGPWQYDAEVESIVNRLLKLRLEFVFPILQTAAKEFLHTGAPLVRPLWWLATSDKTAQRIDCEFLVGNRLLVAPILDQGATSRSVYLPKAGSLKWRDKLHDKVYTGGQWIHDYAVDLPEVAYFMTE